MLEANSHSLGYLGDRQAHNSAQGPASVEDDDDFPAGEEWWLKRFSSLKDYVLLWGAWSPLPKYRGIPQTALVRIPEGRKSDGDDWLWPGGYSRVTFFQDEPSFALRQGRLFRALDRMAAFDGLHYRLSAHQLLRNIAEYRAGLYPWFDDMDEAAAEIRAMTANPETSALPSLGKERDVDQLDRERARDAILDAMERLEQMDIQPTDQKGSKARYLPKLMEDHDLMNGCERQAIVSEMNRMVKDGELLRKNEAKSPREHDRWVLSAREARKI